MLQAGLRVRQAPGFCSAGILPARRAGFSPPDLDAQAEGETPSGQPAGRRRYEIPVA